MITVACVLRQGGKVGYDATWVDKLQHGVKKNLSIPYEFVCLSDCDVPCKRIPLDDTGSGFWSKLQLFKPRQFSTPVLYIDLDAIVCGELDSLVAQVRDQKFVMWEEPKSLVHSSAVMWWRGSHSYLWKKYKSKPEEYWKALHLGKESYGDQGFISQHAKHTLFQEHVPKEWFHLVGKNDHEFDFSDVRILQFIKTHTKPSTMPDHPMVIKHWN